MKKSTLRKKAIERLKSFDIDIDLIKYPPIGLLSSRYHKVLKLRYIKIMTLREIGSELGVNAERTRQIEAKALRMLRSYNLRKDSISCN